MGSNRLDPVSRRTALEIAESYESLEGRWLKAIRLSGAILFEPRQHPLDLYFLPFFSTIRGGNGKGGQCPCDAV
jgi:hypothetical protein